MWALGIILYLMLFGKFPFRATSEKELYRVIQLGKFQMDGSISMQAKEVLNRLLKTKTQERGTASQLLNSSWLQVNA